jgi:hypothetical protein
VAGFGGNIFEGSAVRIPAWGYGLFEVYNSTTLKYTYYQAGSSKVLDEVVLQVNH